MEHSFNVGKTV